MLRRPVPAGKIGFVEDVSQIEDLAARRIDRRQHLPEVAARIQALLDGESTLAIPEGKKYRAIIDLQNYFCARPIVRASQGRDARLTVRWAEALFADTGSTIYGGSKGNRNEIEGRLFIGRGDTFVCDGQPDRDYTTLWWEAGRYLELCIETGSEELLLSRFSLEETRYPLEMESGFSVSDERLERLVPLLLRSLQMNAHETFLDCPYYEQLNYTGDTLLDCLVVYAITRDVRLARKSLQLFHDSRIAQGVTQSRFPSRLRQIIPPFSLLWVAMVRQHAWWRGEPELIRSLLPGTRSVIDAHLLHVDSDGLLAGLPGWNFLDWVGSWTDGVPPQGDVGQTSGPLNWLFVYVLQAAAELEIYAGDPELAARYGRLAETHARAAEAAFWAESQGLFADDPHHRFFSEHAQCLAILGGHAKAEFSVRAGQGLVNAPELQRCTIYFSHYLFETLRKLNQPGPLFRRLEEWYGLTSQGFVTTPEMPEPSRSDCHAWGCHPLFHLYATMLGIRPASMGFEKVEIRPQLGPLEFISGRMVHPKGWVEVDLRRAGAKLIGTITLPETVTGTYCADGATQPLVPGFQQICA